MQSGQLAVHYPVAVTLIDFNITVNIISHLLDKVNDFKIIFKSDI